MQAWSIRGYLAWMFKPLRLLVGQHGTPPADMLHIPGWETIRLISSHEQLRDVNRQTGQTYWGGRGNGFLTPLFGVESVFTLDGPWHRIARRLVSSALTRTRADQLKPIIDEIVRDELDRVEKGRITDAGALARRITMRVTCLTVLGVTERPVALRLLKRFDRVTGFLANPVSYNKALWGTLPFPLHVLINGRIGKVREAIGTIITTRKATRMRDGSVADVLICNQQEAGYSDTFIRDNLVATTAAGYDTNGSALTWMLFWLSQDGAYSHLLDRCEAVGLDRAADTFISETLRICPPLEILPRAVDAEMEDGLADGASLVCPCPMRVHHDPALFENPASFQAERFDHRTYGPTEYFPFGAGSRLCLGMNFASLVMKAVLTELIARKAFFALSKRRFQPIRRNVSLWPGAFNFARLVDWTGDPGSQGIGSTQ